MNAPDNPAPADSGRAPLPPLPPGAPGANGFKYRQRFGLIVEAADEAAQQALHAQLTRMGLKPRVVTV